MSRALNDRPFPRAALIGAGALVAFSLVLAGGARLTGLGTLQVPEGTAVFSRDFRFVDRAEGGVAVYATPGGQLIDVIEPGTNGFIRGALRALARERRQNEIGAEPPFRLTQWTDGSLSLEDTATGRRIFLEAFGPTNRDAFARLLVAGRTME